MGSMCLGYWSGAGGGSVKTGLQMPGMCTLSTTLINTALCTPHYACAKCSLLSTQPVAEAKTLHREFFYLAALPSNLRSTTPLHPPT